MHSKLLSAAMLAGALAACGGGGGGGVASSATPAPAAPAAVQITASNANAVAAYALDNVQNTSAADNGVGLLAGVQVHEAQGSVPLVRVVSSLVSFSAAHADPSMATGVLTPRSAACPNGGTATVSGSVASAGALQAGDSLTFQGSNCVTTVDGVPFTINGSMRFAVTGGSMSNTSTTFHIVVTITTSDLSLRSGSQVLTSSGDLTLDWTHASASDTLAVSGTSLASGETMPSGFHTTTWKAYRQAVSINGSAMTGSLSGSVSTDSSRLGTGGASYTVSTPVDLQWTTTSAVPVAGVIKVVGANSSALQVTFSATGAAIQVDANGDGIYETTASVSVAQLQALL